MPKLEVIARKDSDPNARAAARLALRKIRRAIAAKPAPEKTE
jgi:hypothetical protein